MPVNSTPGTGLSPWVTLEGAPVAVARRVGRGVVATLAFHPSRARDEDTTMTAVLRHLLVWGAAGPVAWLDLESTLVLRMDDPGGAQNVHLDTWLYPKLDETRWAEIAVDLERRRARLSVGYVAGWVDDGEPDRGSLLVDGRPAERRAGRVYPSPVVTYRSTTDGLLQDYRSELRGIQALRAAWAAASDRHQAEAWYRELGTELGEKNPESHPLALGAAALRRHFGSRPTTLICPGDQWSDEDLERALALGLQLVSSYYLALLHDDRFCWTTHVCSPYLDAADPAWFDAGLPVVGSFHDREPSLEGVGWMTTCLDEWQRAGAKRFMDLRELASVVSRRLDVTAGPRGPALSVDGGEGLPLPRGLAVAIKWPEKHPLPTLEVRIGGETLALRQQPAAEHVCRVVVPPPGTSW